MIIRPITKKIFFILCIIVIHFSSAHAENQDPPPVYVGELGAKWKFPSDHLPIGAKVDSFRICSWNVLNTLFLHHIESNSQGLKNSLILTANYPCNQGNPLTIREALTVKMILHMIHKCRYPRDIIGLQEVGDRVLAQLKKKLPSHMALLTDFHGSLLNGNGDVIIYNSRRFKQLNFTVSTYSRKNSIMDLHLQDRKTKKKYQIINTHTPGGPTGGESLHELCLYVLTHCQVDTRSLFMGDINQFAPEIDAALEATAIEFNKRNYFKHISLCYHSHINTHQTAVNIDHFYTTSKCAKGESPKTVLKGLSCTAQLLK